MNPDRERAIIIRLMEHYLRDDRVNGSGYLPAEVREWIADLAGNAPVELLQRSPRVRAIAAAEGVAEFAPRTSQRSDLNTSGPVGTAEAAAVLGITKHSVRTAARRKRLAGDKSNGEWTFTVADVTAYGRQHDHT